MNQVPSIPVVDLRSPDAAAVDAALQRAGFLLVSGHGVDPELRTAVRSAGRAFFALPTEVKARYAVGVGGRGWLGPGREANARADGIESPPDLKESIAFGPDTPTGDPDVDGVWFLPNVWPQEVPALHAAVTRYTAAMTTLSLDLLALCTTALGLDPDTLTALATRPTWTFNINRYPPMTEVGVPLPGQFRIGQHTDFGTVTVLDREPGAGGLQVWVDEGGGADERGWVDAPFHPDAFTVNIGDLLEHWTGLRWRSGRHRVLPPQAHAPQEELMSLVFFFELNHDALVVPLAPPLGRRADLPPVLSAPFLKERLDAISVG